MRLRAFVLLAAAASLAATCRKPESVAPAGVVPPPAPTLPQQLGALAFLAYLGDNLEGSDDEVERKLDPCMREALAEQPLAAGWELTWGPAVYKFALAELDDNMMYVVRHAGEPARLVVVVRGTNADAILDWLVEDFEVREQVPWRYGRPPGEPKIAKGTDDGLKVLQTMQSASGPAPNVTLAKFLADEVTARGALQIQVIGHSLGGALAPVLALWLADTQAEWDPRLTSKLAVWTLAGPTPGDAGFATYYASRLGGGTERLQNPYDVVPLAWNYATMERIADLYAPGIRASDIERGLIDAARDAVETKGYTQLGSSPPLPGGIEPGQKSFTAQAGWQHHCGYQCALEIDVLLPDDCSTPPATPCTMCPGSADARPQ